MNYKKNATVSEIAKQAGVSPATVSRVVNHRGIVATETYDKVFAAMKALGCEPKAKTGTASSNSGILLLNVPSIANPFYSEVTQAAKTAAARHGYHLLITEELVTKDLLPTFLKLIKKTKAAGIITLSQMDPDVLQKLSETIPLVQCCEQTDEVDLPYVTIDDISASAILTEHLLSGDKKKVAFISGPERFKYSKHRLQGYKNALQKAGIPLNQHYIVQLPDVTFDLAVSAARQLLSSDNPPNAVFTCSDVYAAATIKAANSVGFRVPQDIIVSGFDNIPVSIMSVPSITTINQPKAQLGFVACELLLEKINNPDCPNKKMILSTELIVRESTVTT